MADYLRTLRLIPDDIILAIGAQDFSEWSGSRCVCGWALREAIGRELNVSPEIPEVAYRAEYGSYVGCERRFGGTNEEWYRLFMGAAYDTPNLETAFVDRLNEIVCSASSQVVGGEKTNG